MEKIIEKQEKQKRLEAKNEVCKDCVKWGMFGKDCWVYWEDKKTCTMKVTGDEETDNDVLL